jgi:RiboL-PSP-HEPN
MPGGAKTIVDRYYTDFDELLCHLDKAGEISLRNVVEANFRKVLLLVTASYFEWVITQNILEFVGRFSNNTGAIVEFVKNKAMNRQYHLLFDWNTNNANQFYSFFGDKFKGFMRGVIESDRELEFAVRAFMEIGRERNRLVHQDFGSFSLEKTAAEIYELYQQAFRFVEVIPVKLHEYCAGNDVADSS